MGAGTVHGRSPWWESVCLRVSLKEVFAVRAPPSSIEPPVSALKLICFLRCLFLFSFYRVVGGWTTLASVPGSIFKGNPWKYWGNREVPVIELKL